MENDKKLRNFVKPTIREFINEQFDNNENMRNLISKALNDAFTTLENQVPQTKKKKETISIQDVKPSQLMSFMKSNDIPNDAYFTGADNGYDGWDDIVLAWEGIENLNNLRLLYCSHNQFTKEYEEYLRNYCKEKNIRLTI
jgi:hypothetical protein